MPERIVEKALGDARLAAALYVLLDDLREWISVYGITPEAHRTADEYRAEWKTSITEDGPIAVILRAVAETPELWLPTLPKEVAIIPRTALKNLADALPISSPLGEVNTEFLEHMGLGLIRRAADIAINERIRREERHDA